MQNEAGDYVDLYLPRKCSVTNRIIAANDHAAVQLNVADVDETTGIIKNGQYQTYAFCGNLRAMGEADDAMLRLCQKDAIVKKDI